jgi:Glycoside hydrolase family 44
MRKLLWVYVLIVLTACAGQPNNSELEPELFSVGVYGNALSTGWQSWSWGSTINVAASGGLNNSKAISATITTPWAALFLHNDTPVDSSLVNIVQFYINGGSSGGQSLQVKLVDQSGAFLEPGLSIIAPTNTWTRIRIPIGELGAPSTISGLIWQDNTGKGLSEFKLDNISFIKISTPVGPPPPEPSLNQVDAYFDAYESGFYSWSWSTRLNPLSFAKIHTGTASLAVTMTGPWAGAYLHSDSFIDASQVNRLRFWIHGGTTGNQKLRVMLANEGTLTLEPGYVVTPVANTWTLVDIALSQLGSPESVSGIVWQDTSGAAQATFYLDEVSFYKKGTIPPPTALKLTVDTTLKRHAISEDIYGLSWANESLATDLRLPLNRSGGNAVSRYNYKVNNTNRGSDYFFESGIFPNENVTTFIAQNKRTNTKSLLTMPMMGWVAKSTPLTCGFSVSKYGAQTQTDQYNPDCGNGIKPDGSFIIGNNPADTSTVASPAFIGTWVRQLVSQYGRANAGGVRYYALDNEPALWNSTHRDIHPEPLSYDELLQRTIDYSLAIKQADPTAQTLGPVEWGWPNYFYSAKDIASGADWVNTRPDRRAHGDMELVPWYLDQLRQYELTNGKRLLNYLDLHFYPQGQNVSLSDVVDPSTKALRLRSTRALWDPTYTDESWINDKIGLIPRMRAWVNTYYPNTKLAITEYNWGALKDINGALAQADVLGILGRENVSMAMLWGMPDGNVPGVFAFRMYRNYAGSGKSFGQTSVSAVSQDQGKVGLYAAERSDGALTIMAINKGDSSRAVDLSVKNFLGATAQVYRYSAANLNAITRESDATLSAGKLSTSLPGASITLFVLPKP